jgi:hypothetical protein
MEAFLIVSGLVFWCLLGVIGILYVADMVLDWIVSSLNFKREFLAFCWERLKQRRALEQEKGE